MEKSKLILFPVVASLILGFAFTVTTLIFIFQVLFFPIELLARAVWSGVAFFRKTNSLRRTG